jgi:hypothetical protein
MHAGYQSHAKKALDASVETIEEEVTAKALDFPECEENANKPFVLR